MADRRGATIAAVGTAYQSGCGYLAKARTRRQEAAFPGPPSALDQQRAAPQEPSFSALP